MDRQSFDDWTKLFATGCTRRILIKALAGAAAGALLGGSGRGGADARSCRDAGRTCREASQCCSGICGAGANGRRVCVCPEGTASCRGECIPVGACCTSDDCPSPPLCHRATCEAGVCVTKVTPGRGCDDGDVCTVQDTCQADGTCRGGPAVCDNGDQCHNPGTCDAGTGECGPPAPKPDGTRCSDDNACTDTDTCQGGICTPGSAVSCQPRDECHAASCDPATGQCVETALTGTPCGVADFCTEKRCVTGVCQVSPLCESPFICREDNGCCLPDSTICDGSGQCCSDICDSGTCVCRTTGGACTVDRNCCDEFGSAICSHGHCCPVGQEWVGTRCCPIGFHDDNGFCCLGGFTNCGGVCVLLDVDLNHCGQCFQEVPPGGICIGGQPQCPPGVTTNCGGQCKVTVSDPTNCGACNRVCDTDHPICIGGRCCNINSDRCV